MEIILYSIKYYVIHSNGVYGMAYARPMLKNSVSTVLLINKTRFINIKQFQPPTAFLCRIIQFHIQ